MSTMENRKARRKLNRTDTSTVVDRDECKHDSATYINGVGTCDGCGRSWLAGRATP